MYYTRLVDVAATAGSSFTCVLYTQRQGRTSKQKCLKRSQQSGINMVDMGQVGTCGRSYSVVRTRSHPQQQSRPLKNCWHTHRTNAADAEKTPCPVHSSPQEIIRTRKTCACIPQNYGISTPGGTCGPDLRPHPWVVPAFRRSKVLVWLLLETRGASGHQVTAMRWRSRKRRHDLRYIRQKTKPENRQKSTSAASSTDRVVDTQLCELRDTSVVRMLWYPLSPVAALCLVASVPSSYQAGVIACLDENCIAPSFRRHPASQQTTNTSN